VLCYFLTLFPFQLHETGPGLYNRGIQVRSLFHTIKCVILIHNNFHFLNGNTGEHLMSSYNGNKKSRLDC
jgi:hypothetical protein